MTIVLGIDRGSRMLGLAKVNLSDKVIFPIGFMKNDGELYFSLAGIIAQEKISQIVVGLPQKELAIQEKIKAFVKKMQMFVEIPVEYVGEDYTSVEAGAMLSEIQKDGTAYKKTNAKDTVAAMKILERWMITQ
ncbi:MAG: RuvX/YqgF family protein [Candidatus Absconditabacteria bacterium]|nr:RuvX/YqgF family protein [Candidatus Absconditabacteria bacterium]